MMFASQAQGLLVAQVVGMHLALPLQSVQEIVPVPLLARPPGAAPFIEGFFDYRGQPVPVLRLDRLLGAAEERLGVHAPLVILRSQDSPLALQVKRTVCITGFPAGGPQAIEPAESFNGLLAGRLTLAERTVYLLAVERLLLAKEREALAVQQEWLRQRLALVGDGDEDASAPAGVQAHVG